LKISPRLRARQHYFEDIDLKGGVDGTRRARSSRHALAAVAELPVLEAISAGEVVYGYLR